jgi:transposase
MTTEARNSGESDVFIAPLSSVNRTRRPKVLTSNANYFKPEINIVRTESGIGHLSPFTEARLAETPKPAGNSMSRNKLSRYLTRKIISCFALELTATQTARLMRINRNTVNRYYRLLRQAIARFQDQEVARLAAETEPTRNHSQGKEALACPVKSGTPVYGFLGREGKVYTQVVLEISPQTLRSFAKQRPRDTRLALADGCKRYDGFIFDRYEHIRIAHGNESAKDGQRPSNGIESFWSYYKNRLSKYCGINPRHFHLHLKECEFRFNHRTQSIEPMLFELFQKSTSTN